MHRNFKLTLHKRKALTGMILILPGFIGFAFYILIPLFYNLYHSAFNRGGRFALLANYRSLFNSHAFMLALRNTGLYLIIGGGLIIIISLLLAQVIFEMINKNIRLAIFAKISFLMPLVVPTGVSVIFVQILFATNGSINTWLGTQTDWLNTPFAFWILVMLYIWKNFGYFVIIFFVAFSMISPEVYEAAKCDGAGKLRILFSITLPQIVPSLFFVFIMSIIGVFKMNRESYLLFGNYPNEAAYMFQNFIKNNLDNMDFGRAASSATVFLLIFSVLIFFMIRLAERNE